MADIEASKKRESPSVNYVEVPEEYRAALNDCVRAKTTTPQLPLHLKSAVLSVSSSVVALCSFSGEPPFEYRHYIHNCSGVIVSCEEDGDGGYRIEVVTAAKLLANASNKTYKPQELVLDPDLKVQICPCNGRIYHGELSAHDFHYNVAVIKFKSDVPFQSVNFKHVHVNVPFQVKPHCSSSEPSQNVQLSPGDKVVALGRLFHINIVVAEEGAFSILPFELDCQELLITSCKKYKEFTGGPLINDVGDVIGIVFCLDYCGFLPSNIISRCPEHLKRHQNTHWPYHGMRLRDLYAVDVALLEKIARNPGACRGVIVEKVKKGSPAELAGILPYDAIIQCGGSAVESSLKLLDLLWYKIGESLEMEVIRTNGEHKKLSMVVQGAERCNWWPLFNARPKL